MRRRLFALRDHPEARPRPPMADAQRVNDTLGEMWTVAPSDMMAIVERMQDHLQQMELLSVPGLPDAITDASREFDALREALVNKARSQTGEHGLPSATFRCIRRRGRYVEPLVQSGSLTTFTVATNEYRGGGNAERTEYHPCVAWDRLAEICGQFLSKGQLVDIEGRAGLRLLGGFRGPVSGQ